MADVKSGSVQGKAAVAVIDGEVLRDRIYEIRGQKVMLDFELAEIYGYSTKAFNQQVQRNIEKFDEDFMFQLTDEEWVYLRSQIVTANPMSRTLPYAFTEQGVYMLMTVLKGELATRQSKALIRLFKRMKDYVIENQGLVGQREFLLNGSPVEANEAYSEIYGSAQKSVFVIDNCIGMKTLVLLKNVPEGVPITVFSDNRGRGLHACELADFHREYPDIEVELREAGGIFHDRYVVVDFGFETERIYHYGASSKDAGDKATTISEVPEREAYRELITSLQDNRKLKLPA